MWQEVQGRNALLCLAPPHLHVVHPLMLISGGESLVVVVLLPQFVNHGVGIILHGNEALAFLIEEHIVLAQTELSCPFARTVLSHVTEISGGRTPEEV